VLEPQLPDSATIAFRRGGCGPELSPWQIGRSNSNRFRYQYLRSLTDQIMTSCVTDQKIRVLIADDHPIFREGLTTILSVQKDMKVVGEASDGEEACQLYDELSPDILILDLRMPKKEGLEVVTELMARAPAFTDSRS
jgi:PleD family two-component response regulator